MAKMTREEILELAAIIKAEEKNQRPIGPLHDIRPFLPLTAQTNPAAFPQYQFREYPKQMTKIATKEDVDAWKERNQVSDDRGGVSYRGAVPKVGKSIVPYCDELGKPVTVDNRDEEDAFLRQHGQLPGIIAVDVSAASSAEIARLEEDNKRLKELIEQNAALTAQAALAALAAKPAAPVHVEVAKHSGKRPPAELKLPD